MKRTWRLAVLAVIMSVIFAAPVSAFEPGQGLQWLDPGDNPLSANVSFRYFLNDLLKNTEPLKLENHHTPTSNPTNYRMDLHVQYRLVENPLLYFESIIPEELRYGNLACAADIGVIDGQDAYDRFELLGECGYTIKNKVMDVRLDLGHFNTLNFGSRHYDRWGGNLSWVGLNFKLLDNWHGLSVYPYSRYYFFSNMPAKITDNAILEKSRLREEAGVYLYYKVLPHLTVFAAPYANTGDEKWRAESYGIYAGARVDIGEWFFKNLGFLKNLSVQADSDFKWNATENTLSSRQNEQSFGIRAIWEFK